MPNWKKVIVSGSNAHLNNITASGHFSALNNGFTVNNHSSTELFVDGNIIATGDVVGENYIVSSTIMHMTQSFSDGSTIFGDTLGDTHLFTGSLFITGITFDDTPVSDAVVVIDTSSGRLYYTGSYGGSGGSGTGFPYAGSDSLTADPPIAVITGSLLVSGSGHITASGGDVLAKKFITDNGIKFEGLGLEKLSNTSIGIVFSDNGLEFKADSGDKFIFNQDFDNVDFEIFGEDNNATFYVDASNNNVGIGTTSPFQGNKLDVNGGVRLDNITASNDISGSGALFASLSFNEFDGAEANLRTVVYAPSNHSQAGKLFFTSAFSEGGGGGGGDMSNFKITSDDGGGTITVTNNNTVDFEGGSNITTSHNTSTKTVTIDLDDRITVTDVTASNISLADSIVHTGDTNTKMAFGADTITFTAGGNTNTTLASTLTTFDQNVIGEGQGQFINDGTWNWGGNTGVSGRSGFRTIAGVINKSYSHLTPQKWNGRWAMIGMPVNSAGTKFLTYPSNFVVYGNKDNLSMFVNPGNGADPEDDDPGGVKPDIGGGGNPGVITGIFNEVDATGKKIGVPTIQVRGGDLEIVPSGAIEGGNTAGIRIASGDVSGSFDPGIFFYNRDNKTNVSGSFFYQSASAEIRFDSASNSIKFLSGDTNTNLQEILHVSRSGNSPRVGIGTSDPKSTFDFKQVEDTSTGTELLLRTARTSTTGALDDDEGGSINFVIDSGSFNNIKTSGSLAKIKTKVNSVGATGVQGKLIFELSKGARDSNDVFSFGFAQPGGTLGDFGLYSQIQTASLLLRDFSSVGNSVIEMRDSSDNFKLQIGRGNITASGGISASGTITANSFVGTLTGTATGLAGTPDITVGSIEATSLNVTSITSSIVTSSIVQTEGSNIFGDAISDTQTFNGHITASGNISASGNIITQHITASNNIKVGAGTNTPILLEPRLINFNPDANGNGVRFKVDDTNSKTTLSGLIEFELNANRIELGQSATQHVTASGNISSSGTIIGSNLSGTNTGDQSLAHLAVTGSDVIFGNITASGDISASGNISGEGLDIDGTDTATFRSSVQIGKLDRPITLTPGTALLATRPTIEGGGSSHIDFTTGINLTTEKKISFDSDTTNTYIAANNENPEDLEIHADQDIILNPDGQVIANSHISASGAITASAFKGDGSALTNLPSQTDENFTTADHSKLDGIEANADVTDTTNVTAAGALMDSELTEIATVKTLTAAGISGSFNAASASFSTRVTANEVVTAKTLVSGSAQIADVTLTTAAQTNITSLGTLTTLTVDDITINGSTISDGADLTIDAEGDITLDANGADVILKDDGTEFGRFKRDSSDFIIKSATNNKDIVFRGVDNSATITALTLDMSDAGKALFNSDVSASGIESSGDIHLATNNTQITQILANGVTTRDLIGFDDTNTAVIGNTSTNKVKLVGDVTASNNISASGTIIASAFTGDGSGLTGVGTVDTTGTPADSQIAVFTDANTIEGTSKLTFSNGDLIVHASNADNSGIEIFGGVVGTTHSYISPIGSQTTIQFGDGETGHIFDLRRNKLAFDGDSTNTYIQADSDDPENLEIHADNNIELKADNLVTMTTASIEHRLFDTGSTILASNGGAIGDIVKFGGTGTTAGKVYYLKPDGTWGEAQADAGATASGSLAIALGSNSTTNGMCLRGFIRPENDPSAGIGSPVFLSDAASGRMLATAPDTSGDIVRILGHQFGTDLIYFNPSPDFIEVS